MSTVYQLPWSVFPWTSFQQLSLLLAEELFPGTLFDEYLKQGATQEGIDLISTKYENGKTTTIQCKKEIKLSSKDIEDISTTFLNGKHAAACARFIIATTANLQHNKLQDTVANWKKKMYDGNGIELEVWDKNTIEKLLLNSWRLTARYFGKEAADSYCISEVFNPDFPELPAIDDYIPRKITAVSEDEMRFYLPRQELLELKDMFSMDNLKPQRIGILGSPYFGKTTYLKQTAYLLHTSCERFYPLFLEVKNVAVQPIEELLEQRFGQWKSLPFRSLVLIIDGLDEVRTDRFGEFVRNIHTFSQKYHTLHIVISCRRLFFEKYDVGGLMTNFRFFELFRLDYDDVNKYLTSALKSEFDIFMKKVNRYQLYNSLYHPFYIENLVRQFKKTSNLPKSKIEVIQNFINNAYDLTKQRQLTGGENLKDESVLFAKAIRRFALALQVAGLNSLQPEQIQGLFTTKERELLQHNSLINANTQGWSFTNAMFQEHFAALALTDADIATIKRISSVGTQVRKIKMKWLQTLASLLSILDDSKPLFQELLTYIKEDNIELLFMAEPTKFQRDFRYNLLEDILLKVKNQQVRPAVASERSIGDFMDGIDQAVELLFANIEDTDNSWVVKVFCCDVLAAMHLGEKYHERLRNIVVAETNKTNRPYYAANLVELLIIERAGTPTIVDKLVKIDALAAHHDYRQKVYELITQVDQVDTYFNYVLDGVQHLLIYNRSVTHAGSEYSLEEALIGPKSYPNFCKLFETISDKDWIEKYRYSTRRGMDFLARLLTRCAKLYPEMPWIIYPVVKYMKMMGNHHLREAYDEFDEFFKETGADWIALRIMLPDLLADKYWHVGAHVSPDCFDYLLFEMEERNAGLREVRNVLFGLRFRKEQEEFNQFWKLCDDMLGGEITKEAKANPNDAYEKAEAIKKANDRIYIQSAGNFRKGILDFFTLYGKKSLDTEDLYIEPTEDLTRNKFDSSLLFRHFIDCKREDAKRVTLKSCLKITENEEWFDYYRIWFILHNNSDPDPVYTEIAKDTFDRDISSLDFANCYWDTEKGYSWKRKQAQVGELFEKFAFDAPVDKLLELLWLDHGGIRGWDHENTNHRKSIAQIAIEKLGDRNLDRVKEKVLANMRMGIKCREVMGTHISLSSRFKIMAARDIIWEQIMNGTFSQYEIYSLVAIYLELGGDRQKVANYFSTLIDYSSYSYWKLVELLIGDFAQAVKTSLSLAIVDNTIKEEDRITANMYLSSLGEIDGFAYLVSQLSQTNRSPYYINGKTAVHNVDTASGLKLIKPIAYIVVDPSYDHNNIHDSPRNLIIEWLYGFASKSETDMQLVLDFIYAQIEALKPQFPGHAKLYHWYSNKILEDFRASDKREMDVGKIKQELAIVDFVA